MAGAGAGRTTGQDPKDLEDQASRYMHTRLAARGGKHAAAVPVKRGRLSAAQVHQRARKRVKSRHSTKRRSRRGTSTRELNTTIQVFTFQFGAAATDTDAPLLRFDKDGSKVTKDVMMERRPLINGDFAPPAGSPPALYPLANEGRSVVDAPRPIAAAEMGAQPQPPIFSSPSARFDSANILSPLPASGIHFSPHTFNVGLGHGAWPNYTV